MCEILCLIGLSRLIASMAQAKHKPAWPFVLLLIFLWFGGELFGLIAGVVAVGFEDRGMVFAVAIAYICAFVGAGCAFLFLNMLPATPPPPRQRKDYLMDEDFLPRPRSDNGHHSTRPRPEFVDYHEDSPKRRSLREDVDPDDTRFRDRKE